MEARFQGNDSEKIRPKGQSSIDLARESRKRTLHFSAAVK